MSLFTANTVANFRFLVTEIEATSDLLCFSYRTEIFLGSFAVLPTHIHPGAVVPPGWQNTKHTNTQLKGN